MVFTPSLLGAQHEKKIVWRTSQQACLLCPWARHFTRRLHLYVADRWHTRTSPGYNCEVAHAACRKEATLAYPPMLVRLVGGGLPDINDWFELGCHLSPNLIQLG